MNTENEKRLDDLFKKKMEDPVNETRFEEEDWDALERMLDGMKRKKGIVFWLPVLSAAAAVLLLFVGWWLFRVKTETQTAGTIKIGRHNKMEETQNGKELPTLKQVQRASQFKDLAQNIPYKGKGKTAPSITVSNKQRSYGPGKQTSADSMLRAENEILVASLPSRVFEPVWISATPITPVNLQIPAVTGKAKKINIQRKVMGFRPQYAISVLAAPDINGVGSFQQGKIGTNVGLQFSADISRKITISTGAIYSAKPYMTAFSNYHTGYIFKNDPVNVMANCRMIDIPINIGYQVYHQQQTRISVGTGLSSYLMLHENYQFDYDYGTSGPANYVVPNSKKYFFGVVNLNATYQRQLNSKVGISIQPYLKLPLSNIGYGQVKLQTTGVAVGLSWNINSRTNP